MGKLQGRERQDEDKRTWLSFGLGKPTLPQPVPRPRSGSRGFPVKSTGVPSLQGTVGAGRVRGEVGNTPRSSRLPSSPLGTAMGWVNSGCSYPNSGASAKSESLSSWPWGCWLGKGLLSSRSHQALRHTVCWRKGRRGTASGPGGGTVQEGNGYWIAPLGLFLNLILIRLKPISIKTGWATPLSFF